ncbi:P-loop containing nucleoside triphosphate hydrolase [Pseudocohnilembus persalinus]|uniref:Ras-related protein Rab-1 n=1 Tax=Pseudocohnilembus persalinus TaxID=266149 RepID=A0A0V0Q8W2_PSEPJ|nr:P-loop containing nucleoside triphosphate hydrolase [Pseudocohnilembus persalinus]|eukprot:KRW98602.1 P-loop containing nucleoside triphosphate hydrolase [Pseudocohnilembus persalinus]
MSNQFGNYKQDFNNKEQSYDWLVKVLIVGDSAVGKTQILNRFTENTFSTSHTATLGVDFKIKTLDIDDKRLKMQIWDTAGQERFKSITQTYYQGASAIVLVYSVGDRQSFKNIQNWVEQINQHCDPSVCKLLLGNKCDLQRVVDSSEGNNLAQTYDMLFFETSAKENINITNGFFALGEQLKNKIINDLTKEEAKSMADAMSLNQQQQQQSNSGCGC